MEKPPNINLFDAVLTYMVASKSPLLQARLNAMAKEKAPPPPPASAAPIVNIILPNDMFNPYQQHRPPLPALQITGLIPPSYKPGPKLNMAQFCSIFALSDDIYRHLDETSIQEHKPLRIWSLVNCMSWASSQERLLT